MSYREATPWSRGAVALVGVLISLRVFGSLASAQTLIIPSVTASETYDTNVFYTPKSNLEPGAQPEDFITRVTPQINIAHANSLMRGSFSVGALVSRYLHNSNLDYTGYNATSFLDFKSAANKLSQRITSLAVSGTYQYTPAASGFAATQSGLGTGLGTGIGLVPSGGLLNNGLVTNRVSMHRYNLGVAGGYQFSPNTTLVGTYNYSKLTFGSQSGGVNNPLFDTTGHQGSMTVDTKITARDSVGLSAFVSAFIQDSSSSSGTFTTARETLNWTRQWTQKLMSTVSGGANVIIPAGSSSIPGQNVGLDIVPTANVSLSYTTFSEALRAAGALAGPFDRPTSMGAFNGLPPLSGTLSPGAIAPPGQYTTSLFYTYSVYPSYAFGVGPTKTHVLNTNVVGGITGKLTGQAGVNYAHGSSEGSVTTTTYDSVRLTAGLSYLMGPVLANLTYTWMDFFNSTTAQPDYQFSKSMVMLSLSAAFSSDQFFRTGGFGSFGNAGSSGPPESKPDESSDQMITK